MMNIFSGNSDSDEKTSWPWPTTLREGHCDQQSHRCLRLAPVLQSISPVLGVPKTCAASWSGCFRIALFGALRWPLAFCRKCLATPQTFAFAEFLPRRTWLCCVCHCLIVGRENIARSNATSSNKTLTFFLLSQAFLILLCVWISMIIKEMKIAERKSKLSEMSMHARPISTESSTSFAMLCGYNKGFPDLKTTRY